MNLQRSAQDQPHQKTSRLVRRAAVGDSVGGVIECRCRNVPVGLGEPVFDRLEADLAKAMLSLPATKGFEIGSGFAGTLLKGSQHNDVFLREASRIRTATNNSGGVQGGISNGEEIVFRVAFKPTATILQSQKTVDVSGAETELLARGRHDPCVVPRAVVTYEIEGLETDDEEEGDDDTGLLPEEPFFIRDRSGRREKELPDFREYLPPGN
ncbi:MAG TPA: chorismate synthase [Lacunisphaera sp.]